MARITFSRMWQLIQNNYSTYVGKYRNILTPELITAIFWEETLFDNTHQYGGGPAVGFGQVEKPNIPKINDYFGTTFNKDGSDVLINEAQGVQLAGLELARLFEVQQKKGNTWNPREAALKNYAGYPANQEIPPRWLACERALLPLGLGILPTLSGPVITKIKGALRFARACEESSFSPTFP
jgi:hypothetical protein